MFINLLNNQRQTLSEQEVFSTLTGDALFLSVPLKHAWELNRFLIIVPNQLTYMVNGMLNSPGRCVGESCHNLEQGQGSDTGGEPWKDVGVRFPWDVDLK